MLECAGYLRSRAKAPHPFYNDGLNSNERLDWLYWSVGFIFSAACGYVHVWLHDASMAVLMVTGFTMLLAYKRPEHIWRWALLVGLGMPSAALLALATRDHPSRGLIAGSFAGLAFSIVAAVGGKILARAARELFPKKVNGEQWAVDSESQQNHSADSKR